MAFCQLTIDAHLPMGILEQSLTYQAAIRRGEQKGLEIGLAKGLEYGRQVEAAALVLRLLNLRLGPVAADTEATIGALSRAHLARVEDLLAFCGPEDLFAWLAQRQSGNGWHGDV